MATPRSNTEGRIPPQDINAEKSVLGAILIAEDAFPEIVAKIKSTDFYDPRHQKIFQGMVSLYNKNQPIDLLTLTAELRKQKTLKEVGGSPYLTELSNFVPTASHASAYADLVEQASVRRRLIAAGTAITEGAYKADTSTVDLLGQAEKELFNVSNENTKTEYQALEDLLSEAFERIEKLHKNKGELRGLKTGYHDIDNKTAGFQQGDLIIIGGRPSMGKTTFGQNLALNIANINKRGVLFLTMEMSQAEIVDRMISDMSNVKSWNIRTGNVSDDDFAKIGDALGDMSEIPLYIDESSGYDIYELRNKVRRAAHEHDIGAIVIDYLQLIKGSERYAGNRVQEVTEISQGLKTIAKELQIPVIALAQLSRNVTNRENPRPVLSDLRESGSIEQDADIVMFIHRPDYYHKNEEDYEETKITEILIDKHRHGPIGKVELYFDDQHNRLVSLDKKHSD